MLAGLLAAAALQGAAALPADPSHEIVNPSWLHKPSASDLGAVWPPEAAKKSQSGQAVVSCTVTVQGTLRDCKVESEFPPGAGFGQAAIALTPQFLMQPATVDGQPKESKITIPIRFQAAPQVDWRKIPTADELSSAYPARAKGVEGHVVLACEVDIDGALDQCTIASESPTGVGFSAAALAVAPMFLMTAGVPDVDGRRPSVRIPIIFKARVAIPPADEELLLVAPRWSQAPSFAEVAAAYPRAGAGASGYVALRCRIRRDGTLDGCLFTKEDPPGRGFAKAANSLARKFRAEVGPDFLHGALSAWTDLNVRLPDPSSADVVARHIGTPIWLVGLDPTKAVKLFPPEAAAKGLRTGLGVADCVVGADGSLTGCHPLPGDPPDLGFSEAAVKVAEAMRMSPWTSASGPVDGADVRLPIRFNLAPSSAPAPSPPKPN